ncbi:uncharacterized protein LOC129701970 [Leucoraja erinacea]|uniref:uncharacterized protein LOC129701970 n=1 Tax=Leucoraja erinaceus TaxID=7782 RepID=UPI0024556288|nr:uncharacterized protein LOC129701970 [Leucoraja erinacea]
MCWVGRTPLFFPRVRKNSRENKKSERNQRFHFVGNRPRSWFRPLDDLGEEKKNATCAVGEVTQNYAVSPRVRSGPGRDQTANCTPHIELDFSRLLQNPSSWTPLMAIRTMKFGGHHPMSEYGEHSQQLGLLNRPLPTGDYGSRSPQAELGGDSRWRPSAKGSQGSAMLKSVRPEAGSSANHSSMMLKQQAQHSRASNGNLGTQNCWRTSAGAAASMERRK